MRRAGYDRLTVRRVRLLQVDALSREPFGGNPAAVVLEGSGLSEAEMQRIAQEMNLPAAAFLLPATRPGADYRLRWFSPVRELTFCGHATVATVHALVESDRVRRAGRSRLAFESLDGLLPVAIEEAGGTALIWLEPGLPVLKPYADDLDPLLQALGFPADEVADPLPVLRAAPRHPRGSGDRLGPRFVGGLLLGGREAAPVGWGPPLHGGAGGRPRSPGTAPRRARGQARPTQGRVGGAAATVLEGTLLPPNRRDHNAAPPGGSSGGWPPCRGGAARGGAGGGGSSA